MRARRSRWILAPAFVTLLASAWAVQDRFAGVEIEAEQVADSVWCLYGAGGNVGVSSGEDGVLVVDTQFAPLAPKIRAAIDELGGGAPRFVVNTHWHGDHTGGNELLAQSATIVAHENVRRRLVGDPGMEGNVADERVEGTPAAVPVVTYGAGGLSFHLNGEEIRLEHLAAAHTDGDTIVRFSGSGVVHMGDLFFENQYPYVDTSSGGSVRGLLAAVERAVETLPEDTAVIPGHGRVTDMAGLRAYRDMLRAAVGRIEAALEEGADAQEMLADGILDDFDERWGQGSFMTPERFLTIAAGDLAGAR